MKKIRFSEHILPHLIAVLAFLVITVLFFNPLFFGNKSLDQYDIQMWEGSAKALRDYRDATGKEGLWAPSMFSGMPGYLINVGWSNGPVAFIKTLMTLALPHPVENIFVAFVCYYIMLLAFRVRPTLAIAGAIAFGLSSYMIIGLGAGHNGRIGAIAFMPLVIAGIHLAFSNKRLLGFAVTAMGMALHLRENHLQITYYMMFIVVAYGLVRLVEAILEKKLADYFKTVAILIPAVVIAAGTFFGQFWSITEYGKYSMRGPSELTTAHTTDNIALSKTYAFDYNLGVWESMTLFVPNFYGGSSALFMASDPESASFKALYSQGGQELLQQAGQNTRGYWGPQPGSAPYYAGAIICFLFIVGIVYAERKYIWWLIPLALLSLMLSWGSNFASFNYFLFDHFPGYNKFRSVPFALIIILFTMPLMGMLGLEKAVQEGWKSNTLKKLAWPVGITTGLCLIMLVLSGYRGYLKDIEIESQLPVWFTSALRADRKALYTADLWRSFWFIVVFSVALFAKLKNWIKAPVFALITVLLITLDLSFVDSRYFTKEKYQRKHSRMAFTLTPADQVIKRDTTYYRVYSNIQSPGMAWADARTSYFHNSIGGYHGVKLRRYQDLFDSCVARQTIQLVNEIRNNQFNFEKYSTLNMLNVKYFTSGMEATDVIPNPAANGSAWFVKEIARVKSPAEELEKICSVNSAETAVVDVSKFQVPDITADSAASVRIIVHKPNYLKYESEAGNEGLAVFSEIYYPEGWKATIDGKEASILRADYVLRALIVPAGKHTIEFRFEPASYMTGDKVTMASSWLLLLLVIGCLGITLKKEPDGK